MVQSLVSLPQPEVFPAEVGKLVKSAIIKLARYRSSVGIRCNSEESDRVVIMGLVKGDIRSLDESNIDDTKSSIAVNGHAANPNGEAQNDDYIGAQVNIFEAFKYLHGREPNGEESLQIGLYFAMLARGLVDLQESPEPNDEVPVMVLRIARNITLILALDGS